VIATPPTPPPTDPPEPSSSAAPVAAIPASGPGLGSVPTPPEGGGGGPAPVLALLGVLLLGGTGVALTVRNRRLPQAEGVAVHTMAPLSPVIPLHPAGVPAAPLASSLAFERLPDHVRKDLLEISDILRGMEEAEG
jgi:hypothetical protein